MSQSDELHIVEGATTHADAWYWDDVSGQHAAYEHGCGPQPEHQSAFSFPPGLMASSQPPPTGRMATITFNSTPERDEVSPEVFNLATPVVNSGSPGSGALLPVPVGQAERLGHSGRQQGGLGSDWQNLLSQESAQALGATGVGASHDHQLQIAFMQQQQQIAQLQAALQQSQLQETQTVESRAREFQQQQL